MKINKKILSLILVLPILVMLAHDIIPHHHHKTITSANFEKLVQGHNETIHTTYCNSDNKRQHITHFHKNNESICCSFVNLRFFKFFKFQMQIAHIILDIILPSNDDAPIRYFVSNSNLVPEPDRESTGLRGPPLG
ncbi:hypothetical protein [Ancylomarina sp. 16SWW S1-10-2]|uniref:hypothetical protein n=1 Tax=Ancylomarina sp. 16SWW S1-10-2 TaxID=2499681 RepID=UPI0012ADD6DE|nr:hypothetical protein [Ancylomarina sp. 16SWW S1-10-2]MRT92770.1 hypothetical protein [Ancylomarina sp. 16SWW S1-10-2]